MPDRYLDAFHQFLDVWLGQRSLEGIRAVMDACATGFGTGVDEIAIPVSEVDGVDARPPRMSNLELFARDLQEAPDAFTWTIREQVVQPISPQSAVVMAVLDLSTVMLDQAVRFNGLRMTLVFVDGPDGPKLCHDHVSFPTQVHGEGESYPLKELEDRLRSFERLLKRRTRTLQEAYQELSKVANTDRLTGIASRTRIDEALDAELQRFKRYSSPFSVLFFDIDGFKRINDQFGHAAGDDVLCRVAGALVQAARSTDVVGRWGGDEFMAILPETELLAAEDFAQRLVALIRSTHSADGRPVGVSMGIAMPRPDDTMEALFTRVDGAMYRAKAQGGGIMMTDAYTRATEPK